MKLIKNTFFIFLSFLISCSTLENQMSPKCLYPKEMLEKGGIINREYTGNIDKELNKYICKDNKNSDFIIKEITIENNTTNSGFQIELWGNSFYNKNKPKPTITNKLITPKELIDFYTNKDYTRSFRTNKKTFDTCKSDYCMLGNMELGKRIINILETGNIVDESNIVIGNITKTLFTEENPIEKFNIIFKAFTIECVCTLYL